MSIDSIHLIAQQLSIHPSQVAAVAALLAEGATIPFIARYRKEATGSLDEIAVGGIRDRLDQLRELNDRRESILKSLAQHGHLTDELKAKVLAAETMAALEDLYLPFRPKRRTRAMAAREKGLDPLARLIFDQKGTLPETAAAEFVDSGKGVESIEDALAGARDIIAEMINEDAAARTRLRDYFWQHAKLISNVSSGMEAAGAKFRDYFDWEEPAVSAPSHRVLAMRRGEREEVLNLSWLPPEAEALDLLDAMFVKGTAADAEQVRTAAHDAYRRLLSRSLETELRLAIKVRADAEAIRVFAENLRELLLASPLGPRRVLAVDPGFRTGCKLACLDEQGRLLHHATVFPHGSDRQRSEAAQTILQLVADDRIEVIAVGNGTAGRETDQFLRSLALPAGLAVVQVDESGASIYSASETARLEFPDLDLTVRGTVSIGRRLMDPLAELVKIDPKSIGVGQYQHDVDPAALRQALDDVVISCVNRVGVDLNQASLELLTYVSGLGPQLAQNILAYRHAHGPFRSRTELLHVPRLGPKAFEQCAGFLRIRGGDNPLDASAVHPESYPLVQAMASDIGCSMSILLADPKMRTKIDLSRYVSPTQGLPTLQDILTELEKPGRDPRREFELFAFARNISDLADLTPGMRLPGMVTNVTAFGAFVDVGVHHDGLVHISELSDRFVKNPLELVKVHQKVEVTVLSVDTERRRFALSMKTGAERRERSRPPAAAPPRSRPNPSARGGSPRPFHNPFEQLLKKPRG
ncbi:MAG: RNA-binding transcriptional accessory protein [Desulfobacterales bacterium]|jgi:uncharacterized protein|nr:RNA-binding transcriptional accessory protein [Desulfobacterales bacterium]